MSTTDTMPRKPSDGDISPCSFDELTDEDEEDAFPPQRRAISSLQDDEFSEFGEKLYHQEQEHEAMRQALKHTTVIFAGNPGTGKSTLLNSLVQPEQPQFKAGISFGEISSQNSVCSRTTRVLRSYFHHDVPLLPMHAFTAY
eukprot:3006338-Rhodomonas_salina.2